MNRPNALTVALRIVARGVLTSTAPRVPPRTIMAAVNCEMSLSDPPSRIRPPTIARTAITSPPKVVKSSFGFGAPGAGLESAMLFLSDRRHYAWRLHQHQRRMRNRPPVLDDALDDFFRALEDDQLLIVGEGDDRVGCRVDILDQFGIQDKGCLVYPRQANHGRARTQYISPKG